MKKNKVETIFEEGSFFVTEGVIGETMCMGSLFGEEMCFREGWEDDGTKGVGDGIAEGSEHEDGTGWDGGFVKPFHLREI